MAELKLMEVRGGAVIVGIDESGDERSLTSTLGMSNVGSDDMVDRIFVMLTSMEPGEVRPRLDGRIVGEDGRPVSVVISESKVPARLLISDAPGRKVVTDPRRADVEARGFVVIVIALTIGILSGPTLTARLAIKITVLVPLRGVPVDALPSPFVKVHTPSV